LERARAVVELKRLLGQDLIVLAREHGVTVWRPDGTRFNKGWAGHVIERCLGLPLNSACSPNFGSWELKVVPLKTLKRNGRVVPKETMAITMIDPTHVAANSFENSHLFTKLRKMVVCARMDPDGHGGSSELVAVETFDLDDEEMVRQVKEDYDLVRTTIIEKGFDALTGKMGVLVQPRTKGAGHGSTSRAFYARTRFVRTILGLDDE
jgi:DNA mismatch repair protein MutH